MDSLTPRQEKIASALRDFEVAVRHVFPNKAVAVKMLVNERDDTMRFETWVDFKVGSDSPISATPLANAS